uniref:Phosphatidylcholine transfer protein n=1 Tax=Culicoides sonorensis TaxID=179676 RepID=A0A336KQ21_CULSO
MKKVNNLIKQLRWLMERSIKDRSFKMALWVIKSPLKNEIVYHNNANSSPIINEVTIRGWYKEFRRKIQAKLKGFVVSASILGAYDWKKERIEFDSVKKELKEFELVDRLKQNLICQLCAKRILIGNFKVKGIDYCNCDRSEVLRLAEKENGKNVHDDLDDENGWEPYIERSKMITWRREVKPGLYAYKVYVEYPDVSPEDFLFVQTNNEYRKKWDNTAIKLDIVDSEEETNSQVIYWEMLWPKLFSNRDYVYNRRYFIDEKTNLIIIVNKSTQHPKCPENYYYCVRVKDYYSYMVIRPKTTFTSPGLEFVLTYFDNPGLSIPTSITTWVAQRQMPDFLDKLHNATLNYAKAKELQLKKNLSVRIYGFHLNSNK